MNILVEWYLGLSPLFVLIGAAGMTLAVIWLGIAFLNLKNI